MAKFFGDNGAANEAVFDGHDREIPSIAVLVGDFAPDELLTRWDLEITAYGDAVGSARIGRVLTVPPGMAAFYGGPGVQARSRARVVALATCPGARRWRVTGRAVPWEAPGSTSAITYDPASFKRAQADVLISPFDVAVSAPGVLPVDSEIAGGGDPTSIVTTAQLATGAVAQLVLPYDDDRVRAVLAVVSGGPIFIGPDTVAAANGLPLKASDPPFVHTARRPLFAASAAAAVLAVMIERA